MPVVGDWTGSGYDTIGVFDQHNGNFLLRNSNTAGLPDETFTFGNPNDMPLAGRWMSSATHAGVGVYRPTNGLLFVKSNLTSGFADHTMVIGVPGDQGIAGDWTGKSYDSPGIYRASSGTFYLSNQIADGPIKGDIVLQFGTANDVAFAGDWIGQGHDGVGLYRSSTGSIYLRNTLTTGSADNSFLYGSTSSMFGPNSILPFAGHWQLVYPPVAPRAPGQILIPKTAAPVIPSSGGSVSSGNGIGG